MDYSAIAFPVFVSLCLGGWCYIERIQAPKQSRDILGTIPEFTASRLLRVKGSLLAFDFDRQVFSIIRGKSYLIIDVSELRDGSTIHWRNVPMAGSYYEADFYYKIRVANVDRPEVRVAFYTREDITRFEEMLIQMIEVRNQRAQQQVMPLDEEDKLGSSTGKAIILTALETEMRSVLEHLDLKD